MEVLSAAASSDTEREPARLAQVARRSAGALSAASAWPYGFSSRATGAFRMPASPKPSRFVPTPAPWTVIFVEDDDRHVNRLGVKGVGGIAMVASRLPSRTFSTLPAGVFGPPNHAEQTFCR